MVCQTTGVVIDGQLQLDKAIDLPNRSQVRVTVEMVDPPSSTSIAAWESIKRRLEERPIHGGGEPFDRESLYERH